MLPTFVINLDRDSDRLAHMRKMLAEAGVSFERIPGVLGRAVPADLQAQFPATEMNAGHTGTYASHLLAARQLLISRQSAAVVLEDDVSIEPDFVAVVAAAIRAAPKGWDQISLLGISHWSMLEVASLPGDRHLVRYSRFPWTAAGYILSWSGATKLLRPRVRRVGVDVEMHQPWLFGLDFDALGVTPPIVRQDPLFPSSLNSIAGSVRQDVPARTDVAGNLWYLRRLGALGFLTCKSHNLITTLSRHGRPKTTGTIIRTSSRSQG